jgi:hypothetical protein
MTLRQLSKLLLVILVGFAIYAVAQFVVLLTAAMMDIEVGIHGDSLWAGFFSVIAFGLPMAVGFLAGRYLYKRLNITIPRTLSLIIFVAYFASFAFGIPAAQTSRDAWAVSEYKRLKASGSQRVWAVHPYIASYVSFPILPAVIFTYHEYQLDGLYGFGGFDISLWYIFGVKRFCSFPIWLS